MDARSVAHKRLERLRNLMGERGYDAVVVRNVADIRWLTDAARVLDDECAHTMVVTPERAWLHTDSRYFGSFGAAMGDQSAIAVDMDSVSHPTWIAKRILEAKARVVAVEDTLTLGFYQSLSNAIDELSVGCLFARMHADVCAMRMVKDEREIAQLRRAQQITDEAFAHICAFIRRGMTELAIRAELEGYMLSHGAHALSFDSIVASGPNGANPHARPSEREVGEGDLIVIDFGAAYADYHADMTRTVCVGTPNDEQRRVYDVVREAHEAAARAASPGMAGKDLHCIAARVIADEGYGDCFQHGLGHGVGIQIHERPVAGSRSVDVIPVGSVFTIEPGIYLPGKFGIRLEDCGVMREGGFESFASSTHELLSVG